MIKDKIKHIKLHRLSPSLYETFKGLVKKKTIINGIYNFYEYKELMFQYSEKRNELWCSPYIFFRHGCDIHSGLKVKEELNDLLIIYFDIYYDINVVTITKEKRYEVV